MNFKKIITVVFLLAVLLTPTYTVSADADADARAERRANNKAEKEERNANKPLNYDEKLELIIPSQESLFDFSKRLDIDGDGFLDANEKIRLADGDLEQGLLPRIIQIIIVFSSTGFFLFFTFAGVRLLLSRGNEEALTKTKDLIIQGVVGSILIVGSFGIIVGIIRLFDSLR
jgi:hypothetical protein